MSSLKWIDLQVKTTVILPPKKKLLSIVVTGGSAEIWWIPTRCRQGIDLTSRKHCRHCTASRSRRTTRTLKIGRTVPPHGGNGTQPGGIPIMRLHTKMEWTLIERWNLCNQWTNYSYVVWISARIWFTIYRDYIGNSQRSLLSPTGCVKSTSPDTANHEQKWLRKSIWRQQHLHNQCDNDKSDTTYTNMRNM